MNQDSNVPVPKVAAVGIAGTITAILVLIAGLFGITLPESLADNITQLVAGVIAVTTLINFVAGYFKKSNVKEV